jgi:phosphate transport system permease protein
MSDKPKSAASSLQRNEFVARKEWVYGRLIAACGILTIVITIGIVLALSGRAITFWTEVSPIAFFTGTDWSPIINGTYGVLPLVSGTLIVTLFSAVIALPIGLAAAIYLSEYATAQARSVLNRRWRFSLEFRRLFTVIWRSCISRRCFKECFQYRFN